MILLERIFIFLMAGAPVMPLKIIGVVKNFHFESLRQQVGPLCFRLERSTGSGIFKVKTNDIKSLVAGVESTWKKMAPGMPFSYRFLDDSFDSMYRAEQRMGKLALGFAILAIIVASMGLVWTCYLCFRTKSQRNWYQKSIGRFSRQYHTDAFEGFPETDFHRRTNRIPHRRLGYV